MEPNDPNPDCPLCGAELETTNHDTDLECARCDYDYNWVVARHD